MKRRSFFTAALIFFIFSFFQCNRSSKTTEQSSRSIPIPPGGVLVAGLNVEPESLNPMTALSEASRNVIKLVFQPLAKINSDLETFSPVLAKSWEISETDLTITFHLRTDVTWHDGQPFTAQDVVFTHQLCTNPEMEWDGISYKENIRSVTATNDSTVIYRFKSPSMSMLMDAVEGEIVPEHLLRKIPPRKIFECDFNRHPVGCGPFRFVEWRPQQFIVLEKNPTYYVNDLPRLKRVVFKIIPDNVNLYQQLVGGDLDLAEGLLPADFKRLQNLFANHKTSLRPVSYLGRQFDFIGWNLVEPQCYQRLCDMDSVVKDSFSQWLIPHHFFGDQNVRTALTLAIDREKISEIVNAGQAIPLNGPIPPIMWAYNAEANKVWPYDPGRARKILRKAGWRDTDGDGILEKDGRRFSFEMITNAGNVRRQHVLTLLQEQYRAIGVEMNARFVDSGYFASRIISTRDYDAILFGWSVGLKMDLAPLFHSSSFFQPFHFTSYYSSKFDSLEEKARATLDPDAARQTWDKVAYLLSTELPYTWLYYKMECSAIHTRFRNVEIDRRGMFNNVEEWWVPLEEQTDLDRRINQ